MAKTLNNGQSAKVFRETINENFTSLEQSVQSEKAAREAADTALQESIAAETETLGTAVSAIQTDITSLEQDVLAINTELGEKDVEIAGLQAADTVRLKSVVVSTYAAMLTQATGDQVLIFGVTADEMNMGGDKGAYIYIPSFGIGQIAINFS